MAGYCRKLTPRQDYPSADARLAVDVPAEEFEKAVESDEPAAFDHRSCQEGQSQGDSSSGCNDRQSGNRGSP
jgi:hypothetical protein